MPYDVNIHGVHNRAAIPVYNVNGSGGGGGGTAPVAAPPIEVAITGGSEVISIAASGTETHTAIDATQRSATMVVEGVGNVQVLATFGNGNTVTHIIPSSGSHQITVRPAQDSFHESNIATLAFTELDGSPVEVIVNTTSIN